MPLVGFELAIPASERPQTHALDGAATGIGRELQLQYQNKLKNALCPNFDAVRDTSTTSSYAPDCIQADRTTYYSHVKQPASLSDEYKISSISCLPNITPAFIFDEQTSPLFFPLQVPTRHVACFCSFLSTTC
jgi:hypothetical protein